MTYKAIIAVCIACGIASIGITLYFAFAPLVQWIMGWFG